MDTGTFGGDFAILWTIGKSVLAGGNPYAVFESWYPPATSLFFAVFAVVPPATAFVIWNGANLFFLSAATDRKPAQWLLYFPTLFMFVSGQIDLFFLWLAGFLNRGGWVAAVSAGLITLKPQLAFILLPWFLARWLVGDLITLRKFLAASAIIHGLPLLYDPLIYHKWFSQVMELSGQRASGAPGFFGLTSHSIPLTALIFPAALMFTAGLVADEERWARGIFAFINPAIMQYDHVLLIGTAPWWLMVPVSWISVAAVLILNSPLPFALMPLTAIAYQGKELVWQRNINPQPATS